jgi:hypothetical protein
MATTHSDGLSLQNVVAETAEFLSTFSKRLTIEIKNLLHGDVTESGNESQMYEICSHLYRNMLPITGEGTWRFIFFLHEVCPFER